MNSTDRRVRRTQKSLGDALIALALEKEFDEITIQEITDRADIGYRTFFRHYADKDELLNDVLSAVMLDMRDLMSPPPIEFFTDPNHHVDYLPKTCILFEHVQENSDLYRVLLFSNRGLVQPLKDFAVQEFRANFGAFLETDIPFEIITNHLISSIITLLRWWLDNDMCYPPEEMGDITYRLIIQPVRNLILDGRKQIL
ncbi:MAG: TetR/AcrR family transcriptional regulator [Anaerolineales bacterium]|jgi:AcrR family transcriptional regulator